MLGIVSMAGNALKAFGNTHPAVKWGVIVLAFLLAAEFVGKEGISLYRDLATTQATVNGALAKSCSERLSAMAPPNSNMRMTPESPGYDKFMDDCGEIVGLRKVSPRRPSSTVSAPVQLANNADGAGSWVPPITLGGIVGLVIMLTPAAMLVALVFGGPAHIAWWAISGGGWLGKHDWEGSSSNTSKTLRAATSATLIVWCASGVAATIAVVVGVLTKESAPQASDMLKPICGWLIAITLGACIGFRILWSMLKAPRMTKAGAK